MQWSCSWRLCACSFYKLFCDDWHMLYIIVRSKYTPEDTLHEGVVLTPCVRTRGLAKDYRMCACNNITLIFTCPSSWCVHFSALPLAAVQESFEGHPGFQLPTDGYVLDLNRPPPEPEKFQFCIETLRRNLKKPKSACLNLYTFHTFAPTCFCKFLILS